ncbi:MULTISPECIES: VOC family protein [Pontibacillus]|uniref:VOC family protein n=1 Tax=Pontibacillus chungwhensis TaxID=265426 RepID=A0ABY8V1V0_9BACI|nr:MULTISPECIES: VOC family protein [Pontibacillus]MCD5322180.1 VOC family protein [Pontibacillus sp. HN14]WIF99473.1 VOC family protein [Pontibacillus chungwhensis]
MIERIDTICLKVRDVEKSSKWYQDVLGFRVAFKDKGYVVLNVGEGGVPLTIEEGKSEGHTNGSYPIFFSNTIEQLHKSLEEQGVQVDSLHEDGFNHYFDFYDPDGNRLQVCFFE